MLNEVNKTQCQTSFSEAVNIRQWIQTKLGESNDRAIIEYLRNLHPTLAESGYAQLRNLVEQQDIRIGNSTYITRYFAVPIMLETHEPLSIQEAAQIDPQSLLHSFHKFGLLGKKDGVILLPALVGQDYIDNYSPSGLYNQAQSIFMSSVAGREGSTQTVRSMTSVQTSDGHITTGFLVGVVHWKKGKDVPKMFSGDSGVFCEWVEYASKVVSFAVQTSLRIPIVRIATPQPIFAAFATGQWKMIEAAIGSACREFANLGIPIEASIQISSDALSPSRNSIVVDVDPIQRDFIGCSFEMKLDEVKGLSTSMFIRKVESLMDELDVKIEIKEYASLAADGTTKHLTS
jgi:hypothetical protein